MRLFEKNNCGSFDLGVLLATDEQSDEFRRSSMHLQSCLQCQDRLTRLAADDQTWNIVTESLAEADPPFESTDAQLQALLTPSHPELFGRLGRYEVEGIIGSGGMGVVLKAHDTELNRPVAIKLLAHHLAHNGAARQRFAREARAAAAIVHEHVVAIHNIESDAETPFMVMQYVSGESLQARVDKRGPLGVREILRIGVQAAAALAAAHAQGVVHRDVKPANILLEHGVERTLLTDFGLARVADDATVTRTGIVAGTPNYMSPEQANGDPTDHRSDLFSLGAVLYFMATGRPPFRAERAVAVLKQICHDPHRPAWQVNPEIPDELSDVIDRLLEKKPQRRFGSAEQAGQTLSKLLAKLQETGSLRRRDWYRRWMSSRNRRLAYGLLGSMVVASVLGALVTIILGGRSDSQSSLEDSKPKQQEQQPPNFRQELAAEISPAAEFSVELGGVQYALQRLETQSSGEDGALALPADEQWHQELISVEQDLSRVESIVVPPISSGVE